MAEELFIDHSLSKKEKYEQLIPQIKLLIEGERDRTANLANIAAVLKTTFNFFWVGFYIWKETELVLAPFQGPLACTRIKSGKGVCGTAYAKQKTILVDDVDSFPGHISCSSDSKSEIVVPIFYKNKVVAVLDVDSNQLNDFDMIDQQYLEQLAILIGEIW